MTAAERRARAKVEYDAFLAECPSRQLLDLVTSKWVCLVLAALADGPRRHSELRRDIAGVSQKMLTQTLRDLERDGLVTREVTPSVPVRVDYALTDLGEGLREVIQPLKTWAEANMDVVLANRAAAGGQCA
ncbi:helix-turn-helix domain-containing protein [Intrasporangium sp.]|uniref:winged helix-turn-helix transcriptional regulator n=1 Tax=Intrasporangium sp. TaxID=1925024 RepID=UPI002939CFFE|nr:helix-turn-helix domain-containing protein [Intrasporangium sp.]MDV3221297.1 helix-turn-helix transcriptional regulator [Intrasporangium sp.]